MRRRVGYVIQEGGLFPHLTARANVLLMSRHLGCPAREMEQRLEELCALSQFPRRRSIVIQPSFPAGNASASA